MRKFFAFAAMVAAISMMACAGQQTKEDKEKDDEAAAKCELCTECDKECAECVECVECDKECAAECCAK